MSIFTKSMRFVGDLDDGFYDDERQRDVWNEASAVGFQLFIWASLLAGAVLPWVAGRTGSWIAVGIIVVYLTISFAVLAYSRSRGLDMYTSQKLARPRIALVVGLYLVGGAGAVVNLLFRDVGNGALLAVAMAGGAAIGLSCGAIGLARKRRLDREDEAAAEQAELVELDKEG
ncbi:hypothetical protein [Rhodococcus sovatensis]|uniref:DUF2029 domain-containing protein n=1 Tax=Rhodococcus sovatensis TaxID=1805840 RepID=A0ABZ2PDL0_9NOCA